MDTPTGRNGPVQTLAPGFLGLLGLKQGNLPSELVQQVSPVIEMLPWYVLGNRETFPLPVQINIVAVANYAFPELTVPANEVWWVHGYSVNFAIPAAGAWSGYPVHYTRNTVPIHVGRHDSGGGAAIQAIQTESIGGFFALPGDLFGVLTASVTGAGPINATGNLTISRMPN